MKTFKCEISVRWHELDSFGHLNHATYLSYLDHARWNTLEQLGIGSSQLKTWNNTPVVHSLEIQYLKPAFAGDTLKIESQIAEVRKSSFMFSQTISKGGTPLAQARVRIAIIDNQGRPTRMHENLAQLTTQTSGTPS